MRGGLQLARSLPLPTSLSLHPKNKLSLSQVTCPSRTLHVRGAKDKHVSGEAAHPVFTPDGREVVGGQAKLDATLRKLSGLNPKP